MTQNPYSAPNAALLDASTSPVVDGEVLSKIKGAWIAGCISGGITLGAVLLSLAGTSILGFSAWQMLDVAIIFGLAFGIYKKSRTCAVIMLVYFIANRIFMMIEVGKPVGIVLGLVFAYYFVRGVIGTFEYQKAIRAQPAAG